jgi:hypothetical protein
MTFLIPDDLPEWAKEKLREPLQLPPNPQRDAWVELARAAQDDAATSDREAELATAVIALAKRARWLERWALEMERRLALLRMTPPDMPPDPLLDDE